MLVSLEEVHHGAEVICMGLCLHIFTEIKRETILVKAEIYMIYF